MTFLDDAGASLVAGLIYGIPCYFGACLIRRFVMRWWS